MNGDNYEDLWLDAKAMTMSKARKTGKACGSEDGVEMNSHKSAIMAPSDANPEIALREKIIQRVLPGLILACRIIWVVAVLVFATIRHIAPILATTATITEITSIHDWAITIAFCFCVFEIELMQWNIRSLIRYLQS